MIISAHQPAYLPWIGYFEKIARSDAFVFLDTVQFEKNSYTNRNRIKTPAGPMWLTIPIRSKGHIAGTLQTTQIDNCQPWREKHIKSIKMNYGRAPKFSEFSEKIESIINISESNLADYCFNQLCFFVDLLKIETPIVRAKDLHVSGAKSDLILNICKHLGADHYLSGSFGINYLIEEDFKMAGIDIRYQEVVQNPYKQLWNDFIPNLSVVDRILNCGTKIF